MISLLFLASSLHSILETDWLHVTVTHGPFLLINNFSLLFKSPLAVNLLHDLTTWVTPLKCLSLSFSPTPVLWEKWLGQLFFSSQITGYSMDGLTLGQTASTVPNSWVWTTLFMWEGKVSTRSRCGWAGSNQYFQYLHWKKEVMEFISRNLIPMNPFKFILCIRKREPILKVLVWDSW